MTRSVFVSTAVIFAALSSELLLAEPAKKEVSSSPLTFEQHVRPIFKAACFHCHGEDGETKGKLDLRLVRLMTKGGRSGASITNGDAEASVLWKRIASDEMPKGKKKLSSEEKAIVRRWIEEGAKTARPEPENVEDARFKSFFCDWYKAIVRDCGEDKTTHED